MNLEELRKLRADHNLTQAQLAARMGVSARTLSRWESGETPISDEIAERIYAALTLKRRPVDLARATSTELAVELLNRAQRWDRIEAAQAAKENRL